MSGKLLVFEGTDGCGKTTQFLKTAEYLFKKSKKNYLLLTREPTLRKYGTQVREILKCQTDPLKDAEKCLELFAADRKDHWENLIKPALDEGAIVLCDRFKYSAFAYQQAQGLSLEKIVKAHEGIPEADLILLFDLPASEAMHRMGKDIVRLGVEHKKFLNEKFEQEEFLEKVRNNFLSVAKTHSNFKVIDSMPGIEQVWEKVQKELDEFFGYS